MKFAFLKLAVRDIAPSVAFYRDTIGLIETQVIEFGTVREIVMQAADNRFTLVLVTYADKRQHPASATGSTMGFFVRDVDATYQRALEMGGRSVTAPYDVPGFRAAFVSDPEGNEIEFLAVRGEAGHSG